MHAGELADRSSHLAGELGLRTDLDSRVQLAVQLLRYPFRAMAEEDGPKAHGHVEVLVTVDIPDFGARGSIGDNWIDHVLPIEPEACDRTRVSEVRALRLRVLLRGRSLAAVLPDEFVQRLALGCRAIGRLPGAFSS